MEYLRKLIFKALIIQGVSMVLFLKVVVGDGLQHEQFKDGPIQEIDRYVVEIPEGMQRELQAKSPGIGSGLMFKEMRDGKIIFFAVPDRGMTATLPKTRDGSGVRMFLVPDYVPSIIRITLEEGKRAVADVEMRLYIDGKPASGLPPPMGMGSHASNVELSVSPDLVRHGGLIQGVDAESLDMDKDGNFWVADEYWPAVLHINGKTGHAMKRYLPGEGLPKILEHMQRNNGFEAIAVAPNGKVYIPLETVLNIDGKTAKTGLVIRITELDPVTGKTRMIGYPINPEVYEHTRFVKISDLVAYDDNHFLAVEQGMGRDGKLRNSVYLMNIANADDLTTTKLSDGQELEFATLDQLKQFRLVAKKELFNLRDFGWDLTKMEGLAFVKNGDDRTLAVVNDNDFNYDETLGLFGEIANDSRYRVHFEGGIGQLLVEDNPVGELVVPGGSKDEPTVLWMIRLREPLHQLFMQVDESSGLRTTSAKELNATEHIDGAVGRVIRF